MHAAINNLQHLRESADKRDPMASQRPSSRLPPLENRGKAEEKPEDDPTFLIRPRRDEKRA